jgi:hypothetical protein
MKLTSRFLLIALSVVPVQIPMAPIADAVTTPPITKCHIEIDNPHLSKNIYRTKGIRAVKVNARSICNKPMRKLVLRVEIYKVGFIRDNLVASEEVRANYVIQNRGFKNEKSYVECLSFKSSKYYGVAYAEADIDNRHLKTLHVISEKTNKIKCGN